VAPALPLLWFCEQGDVSEVQAYVDRAWASALERVGLSGLKGCGRWSKTRR
jgi:hypothetical protein